MKVGKPSESGEDLRPEYDFRGGVRGKYARWYREGSNVVLLDSDVASQFKDSLEVNQALRAFLRDRTKR